MMVLIQTDLPEPVVPAINRCGILAILAVITLPAISRPAQKVTFDSLALNSLEEASSSKDTITLSLLGTSIPTAAFPGIGASIRISVTARFNLMSSARFVIRFTLTPTSGNNSYRVTVGPQVTSVTSTLIPKLRSVCSSLSAVSSNCALEFPLPVVFFFVSRDNGGNL